MENNVQMKEENIKARKKLGVLTGPLVRVLTVITWIF